MATRGRGTINLRKMQGQDDRTPVERETAPTGVRAQVSVMPESLEWTAFEHEQVDFGAVWYVVPGGIMAILFALALIVQNYFFAVFVVITFAALVLFRNQPPKKLAFVIDHEGVHADKTLYPWARIASFCIFDRSEHPELSLQIPQALTSHVRIPLDAMDHQRVREFLLLRGLPEEQHQQSLIDEVIRIIGF